jgi:hypothetical protein
VVEVDHQVAPLVPELSLLWGAEPPDEVVSVVVVVPVVLVVPVVPVPVVPVPVLLPESDVVVEPLESVVVVAGVVAASVVLPVGCEDGRTVVWLWV